MLDILKLMENKVYAHGGRGPVEFDCFGFCVEVYKQFGINLPVDYDAPVERQERDLAIRAEVDNASRFVAISQIDIPSLVTFMIRPPYVTHIGVVISPNHFIHMIQGAGVSINNFNNHFWKKRIAGFYQYIGDMDA
jgi:cell wall-associated NlpC family hydrolase